MPLHILLILVVGGIAGIALALHLLGLSEENARAGWPRHRADDRIDAIALSADCRVA